MNIDSLWRENSVHRAAYVDPAVFAIEQERIFRRAWLYVGHESEVPRAGDYVLRRLGPDEVLLVRREDGGLSLLHNRCAHRGARIVAEPAGNTRQLRCPYHAWTYALDGRLIGVPLADGYAVKPEVGLAKVARVESYRGFVFGSHAAQGADLVEFLGGLASAFDNMLDRAPAGTVTRFGGALRLEYRGNWKMFMENAVDLVHPNHRAPQLDRGRAQSARGGSRAACGLANGAGFADVPRQRHARPVVGRRAAARVSRWPRLHGRLLQGRGDRNRSAKTRCSRNTASNWSSATAKRRPPPCSAVDRFNNLVWPNVSVNSRFAAMRVVHALAVDRTQVEVLCFRLDGAAAQMHDLTLQFINLAASPASLVASDDLELFERCQRGLSDAASDWIDLRRGVLSDRRQADGSTLGGGTSELAIRNQFEAWLEHMR